MRLNTYLIHRVQGTQYLIEVAEVASARLRDFRERPLGSGTLRRTVGEAPRPPARPAEARTQAEG